MLQVRNLKKSFAKLNAVQDLSFDLIPGRICGFVGPNGSGKTTTMRMLATLEEPTDGQILLNGNDVFADPYDLRRKLSYMPDSYNVYPGMLVEDYIEFFARAYAIPHSLRPIRIREVMEFTGLDRLLGKEIRTLSKGQMQRLNLGRGLLNDPEIVIMDEPAAGLDPRARLELRFLVKQLGETGRAVLISSHILTELAEMCDDMLIIDNGQLIVFGPVEDFQRKMQQSQTLAVHCELHCADSSAAERLQTWLLERNGVRDSTIHNPRHVIAHTDFLDESMLNLLLKDIVLADFPIHSFYTELPTMEQVFLQITNDAGIVTDPETGASAA